jgi:uncharacterized protein
MTTPASLPPTDRLPTLDILRGFALMGILIMNMPGFASSFFSEADGSFLWTHPVDRAAEQVREALFSGKFNSMFSLLFGIGFTIQYARMQERDPGQATAVYLRRLFALLAFGLIHAFVFWPGDVLHTYALLGFVLVLGLRHVGDRGIVVLIVAGLLYPAVNGVVRLFVMTKEMVAARVRVDQAFEASNHAAFGAGGFFDMVRENARMMSFFYTDWLSLWGMLGWWVMLGMTMLIGVLAGRRRWVQRAGELMPQIRRLMWWALGIGIVCGAAFAVIFELNRVPGPSPIKLLGSVCYSLSRVAMMCFYVLLIVRLAENAQARRWLVPWQAAGRMPLTNYLMQSAICLTLFQGWGFGWWMKVGPAWGLALSLFIFFAIQVPWSLWWLRRHERGPMEALWAKLTYGRGEPAAGAAAAKSAARPVAGVR